MLDAVSARIGMPTPVLRVVGDHERVAADVGPVETFESFIGQDRLRYNLKTECVAATMDDRVPNHILLEGPPGLGKTRLARCIAGETGLRVVEIPATALTNVRDAVNAIGSIGSPEDGPCVVIIDEIHDACAKAQTLLLTALQDGFIQPSGDARRELAPFCAVGCTTNPGKLQRALRDRFTVRESLGFYSKPDMVLILRRYAEDNDITIDDRSIEFIANVGRDTPRVAIGVLRRVAVFARVSGEDITGEGTAKVLWEALGIDEYGLDTFDRDILKALVGQSTPIGIDALAARLIVENDAVVNREPFLMRAGATARVRGGRALTKFGYRVYNASAPDGEQVPAPPWVPV